MRYRTLKCKVTNEIKHVSSLEEIEPDYNPDKYYPGEEINAEELTALGWEFDEEIE